MRSLFVFFLAFMITNSIHELSAQSSGYTIESLQDVYTELTEYESIVLQTQNDLFWEVEFPLDFGFPYYDSIYDNVTFVHDSWGYFSEDQDLSLFLFEYIPFVTELYSDTIDFPSDVRYAYVFSNNLEALVLQFTKNRLFEDPAADSLDTYLNWQVWLFENGVIEIHFGEMHMDGNPIYAPGKGFYLYSSAGIDTTEIDGPHVGISNPLDKDDAIAFSGSYDDYEVTDDQYDVLTVMPPEGWIIRFKPKSVGIFEPDYRLSEVSICPNPANTYIKISEPGSYIILYDFSGQIMFEGIANENEFNISSFPPGIYFVRITSGGNSSIGKFCKA